jgi:hypothetical protein
MKGVNPEMMADPPKTCAWRERLLGNSTCSVFRLWFKVSIGK